MTRFFILFSGLAVLLSGWPNPLRCQSSIADQLSNMTLDEKIGQLFIAPLAPLQSYSHWNDWERLIQECHVGNVIMKASDPSSQVIFLSRLQSLMKIPLFVTADAEWGLGMRMSQAISFPKNLTLGAVQDLSLIEEMGRWVGHHAKQVGIHLNFAPVADVNINPMNPIINMRSFGQDPQEVARRCSALIRGMHQEGLLTCAKHFPGHGDTAIDSHQSLPIIDKSFNALETVELIPFQTVINEGVDAIMSAHLLVSALDSNPVSMSKIWIQKMLQDTMGFHQLIVTDALNMKALTNIYSVEEIALQAFQAGHDLLLYGDHPREVVEDIMQNQIPRAFHALKTAFLENRLSIQDLDDRVRKILTVKEHLAPIPTTVPVSLFDNEALQLKRSLYREAVTVIGSEAPISLPFVYFAIGGTSDDWMVKTMKEEGIEVLCLGLNEQHIPYWNMPIIVGLHQVKGVGGDFGLSSAIIDLLQKGDRLLLFCTPYVLSLISSKTDVIEAYENDADAQEAAFDVFQGRLKARGRLPIEIFRPM